MLDPRCKADIQDLLKKYGMKAKMSRHFSGYSCLICQEAFLWPMGYPDDSDTLQASTFYEVETGRWFCKPSCRSFYEEFRLAYE